MEPCSGKHAGLMFSKKIGLHAGGGGILLGAVTWVMAGRAAGMRDQNHIHDPEFFAKMTSILRSLFSLPFCWKPVERQHLPKHSEIQNGGAYRSKSRGRHGVSVTISG